MSVKYHQIALKDIFSDCQDLFMDNTPSFFQLLEEHFDISKFIPSVFYNVFYHRLGRKRDYPLTGFLSALILHPYGFPAHPSFKSLQGTPGFLWLS